jgi:hypothetical protein
MIKISIHMYWSGIKTLCMFFSAHFLPSSTHSNFILYKRRIYVDTRLHHMLDLTLNIPFFQRGDFPAVVQNGSEAIILANPWMNGTTAAPFDQREFFFFDCPLCTFWKGFSVFTSFLYLYSVLPGFGCGCWWYEWMVPRWF